MSVVDRILSGMKDLITLRDEVDAIKLTVRELNQDVRNHESRLVRIETLVEVAAGSSRSRRLPKR